MKNNSINRKTNSADFETGKTFGIMSNNKGKKLSKNILLSNNVKKIHKKESSVIKQTNYGGVFYLLNKNNLTVSPHSIESH